MKRAKQWVQQSVGPHVEIKCLEKYIPSNGSELWNDVRSRSSIAIHLFSNILDVNGVGLNWLANQVKNTASLNYVVCVGPKYEKQSRISDFHGYFGKPICFSDYATFPCGYTTRTNHPYGVEVKAFKFKRDDAVANDYIEQSEATEFDEYQVGDECLAGIMSKDALTAYHNLQAACVGKFDIFLRPSIGVEHPDFVLANISRGIVLVNVCDDITNFKEDYNRVDAIKHALFDIYVRRLKIGTIINPKVYNTIKIGLYFTNSSEADIEKACQNYYDDLKCTNSKASDPTVFMIKLRSDNLDTVLARVSSDSFKYDYYQEILYLIRGSWHPYSQGDLSLKLLQNQNAIVNSDNERIRVKGVAGCGKTQIVAYKAVAEHLRTGKKVLIVTYNISLIQYIKMRINQVPADFSTDAFDIINYHQFFWSKARRYYGNNIPLSASDDPSFFQNYQSTIASSDDQYDSIIVDEAQDYMTEWFDMLRLNFLKPGGRFIIFGDGEQNIYGRTLEQESKMPVVHGFTGRWIEMTNRISMRLLNPDIAQLASDFSREFDLDGSGVQALSNGLNLYDYKLRYWLISENTSAETLQQNIRWIIENHIVDDKKIQVKDVVVLGMSISLLRAVGARYQQATGLKTMTTFESQSEFRQICQQSNMGQAAMILKEVRRVAKVHFTTDCEELKLSTIPSFKGWESKNIILIIQNEVPDDQGLEDKGFVIHMHDTSPALIYTALTRPKENLFILNLGNETYHNFFKDKIRNE
jgi:hypothetical protein